MTLLISRFNDTRLHLLNEASLSKKIFLSLAFAVILAVCSQIKIYLPFTPIPMNLGTFAVCASALTLGGTFALVSVAIYLLMAFAGLPVTTTGSILGSTTGYLLGYLVVAFVLGKITEERKSSVIKTTALLFLALILVIHSFGVMGLYIWAKYSGLSYTLFEAFMKGSVPFLIIDSIKAIILALTMAATIKK